VGIQPYNELSVVDEPVNHSTLFNAMIRPFTRVVIYGGILVEKRSGRKTQIDFRTNGIEIGSCRES
jgi:hypothetical protein